MSVKGPNPHQHVTASHSAPVDKKDYSHELHSNKILTASAFSGARLGEINDTQLRRLSSKELDLSEREIDVGPVGGDCYLKGQKDVFHNKHLKPQLPQCKHTNSTAINPTHGAAPAA